MYFTAQIPLTKRFVSVFFLSYFKLFTYLFMYKNFCKELHHPIKMLEIKSRASYYNVTYKKTIRDIYNSQKQHKLLHPKKKRGKMHK